MNCSLWLNELLLEQGNLELKALLQFLGTFPCMVSFHQCLS